MKKAILVAAFAAALIAGLEAAPTGPYLSYLGDGVGDGGYAAQCNFVGASSGRGTRRTVGSGFYGLWAGAYASDVYLSDALGYYAMGDASGCTNVVAIGSAAGRGASGSTDCVFIGKNAGRGASGVHGRVDIGGLVYADRESGDFRIGAEGAGLSCTGGVLTVGGAAVDLAPAKTHGFEKLTTGAVSASSNYVDVVLSDAVICKAWKTYMVRAGNGVLNVVLPTRFDPAGNAMARSQSFGIFVYATGNEEKTTINVFPQRSGVSQYDSSVRTYDASTYVVYGGGFCVNQVASRTVSGPLFYLSFKQITSHTWLVDVSRIEFYTGDTMLEF